MNNDVRYSPGKRTHTPLFKFELPKFEETKCKIFLSFCEYEEGGVNKQLGAERPLSPEEDSNYNPPHQKLRSP